MPGRSASDIGFGRLKGPDASGVSLPNGGTWSWMGDLEVATGTHRLYTETSGSLTLCRAALGTAPAGGSVVIDVKRNLVESILPAPLEIIVGAFTSRVALDIVLAAGDFLTVDILQIGTTTPGADLTVRVA